MSNLPSITESEWQIMARLWERFPLTASEIVEMELDGKRLGDSTVRTLLRRLVAKKAVSYSIDENNANLFHYYPLICEKDCVLKESRHFLELYFRNNTSKLFAAFVEDSDMSDEEIEKFKKMLDEKKNNSSDTRIQ